MTPKLRKKEDFQMDARKLGNSSGPRATLLRSPLAHLAFRLVSTALAVALTYSFAALVPASNPRGSESGLVASSVASDPGLPLGSRPEVASDRQGNCGECVSLPNDGVWFHQAMQYLLPRHGWGPGKNEDPEWHPTELKDGMCWESHNACLWWEGTGEGQTVAELQAAIAAAAAVRDIDTLAQLVDLPAVAVIPERTAIQVIGCDGETVVGHVPVEPGVLTGLRAVLADLDP